MPEYLYPGVYVEEVDTGNKPIEGVSTSTVGFLGIAERGPLQPTLVTSFSDFTRAFGSYVKEGQVDRYLAYAVEGFFQNGGERCFVMRVAAQPPPSLPSAPLPSPPYASLTSLDGGMLVQALGPGKWGNRVAVQTAQAGLQNNPSLFKLLVAYWATDPLPNPIPDLTDSRKLSQSPPTVLESFDDLSAIPASSTFYESQVNNVSNLITLKQLTPGRPEIDSALASPPLGSPLASSGSM